VGHNKTGRKKDETAKAPRRWERRKRSETTPDRQERRNRSGPPTKQQGRESGAQRQPERPRNRKSSGEEKQEKESQGSTQHRDRRRQRRQRQQAEPGPETAISGHEERQREEDCSNGRAGNPTGGRDAQKKVRTEGKGGAEPAHKQGFRPRAAAAERSGASRARERRPGHRRQGRKGRWTKPERRPGRLRGKNRASVGGCTGAKETQKAGSHATYRPTRESISDPGQKARTARRPKASEGGADKRHPKPKKGGSACGKKRNLSQTADASRLRRKS